jgi:hypothetical protein
MHALRRRSPHSSPSPPAGTLRSVGPAVLDRAVFGERRPLRPPASGRIRATEYRLYRLLETSHAT